jgi:hypothetical protein
MIEQQSPRETPTDRTGTSIFDKLMAQDFILKYFNSEGDESNTSLNDVINSKPYSWENKGNQDSTFFELPLRQYLHQTPPTSPPSP